MKSIVIGGAGFISSLVSQALIASGRDVTIVDRRPPGENASPAMPLSLRRSR
jgi:UDP-glucose 4-epimerase